MSYRKVGTCKFVLLRKPHSADVRVEIRAEINDPVIPNKNVLVSRVWLLMLESQIGKVSRSIQDRTLEALSTQTLIYFRSRTIPSQPENTLDSHHLATLEIELCLDGGFFVLAHPRDFDSRVRADELAGLIMAGSFHTICATLEDQLRDETLYMLIYGLHKWETEGRPGRITAFTQTWDFNSISIIVESGKRLVQQGWTVERNIPPIEHKVVSDPTLVTNVDQVIGQSLMHAVKSLAEGKVRTDNASLTQANIDRTDSASLTLECVATDSRRCTNGGYVFKNG